MYIYIVNHIRTVAGVFCPLKFISATEHLRDELQASEVFLTHQLCEEHFSEVEWM